MKQSAYILIFFTIVIVSCRPLSEVVGNNFEVENITKNSFQNLNGTYSNNFDTIVGKIIHKPYDGLSDYQRLTILNQLFQNYPETAWRDKNNQIIDPKEKWIKIEFQSDKLATISFYHNDNFIFSKNIHGKFRNGYFYMRPKIYVVPFVPLVFGYNFERARIGRTNNDKLLVDYKLNRWGFALFGGSEDNGVASTIYRKKNK